MENKVKHIYSYYLKHPVITTDSRNIKPRSVFFALKGENFNGNRFASQAIANGAGLAIVDEKKYCIDNRYILVDDTLKILQELAKHHRKQLKATVIGITGTNGKTTTKELILATLSQKYKTKATEGNLNNHIGVPLTILSFPLDIEFAVIEMGANHQGEIASLCEIAQPNYGIITNIGKAHLEGFGGFDGVIKAKSELYHYINSTKQSIFINTDNDILTNLSDGIRSISYGTSEKCFCQTKIKSSYPYVSIQYKVNGQWLDIESKLFGSYNFENISAAICIAKYFKVPENLIRKTIAKYEPRNNRSQIITTEKNKIILDAYNANPSSMKAAIQNFLAGDDKNKILVLGDMFELGKESLKEHTYILSLLESLDADQVFLVGNHFIKIDQKSFRAFLTSEDLHDYFNTHPVENATILIKASRGIKLETIVKLL